MPFGGEAYQDGTSTRDTKIMAKPVGSDAGDIASAVSAATGPGPASLMPTSRFAYSHSLAVPFGGEAYQDGTSTRDTKIPSKPVGSDAGDIASAVSAATGPRPASLMPTSRCAENDSLAKPIEGPAVLSGPLMQNAPNPTDSAEMGLAYASG